MEDEAASRLPFDEPEQSAAAAASPRSVYSHDRAIAQGALALPPALAVDAPNHLDGRAFLAMLPPDAVPLAFFDPQYRGVLDRQRYGNEGARQQERAVIPQMSDEAIGGFVGAIARVLMPSGHLLLWVDKFHLCEGIGRWLEGTDLKTVDLVTWNKRRFGMGYRTRRVSEYLMVLQKMPLRAKGCWTAHDIPDVWEEKAAQRGHAKPVGLQARLVEALTGPGETVVDPAAGTYSVLQACRRAGRRFLGCDVRPATAQLP
ncbi:MAG: DNA methyltransferase [Pseudomonadota bacterium]